ncbi:MAG: hypothetical protein K1X87_10865 [Dehalococcoidia bacterium]|nr:hypothetical protein [Dehalococcoidia bacterium]
MGLLADFRAAAVKRRHFPDDERLAPASLFSLVRDMPLSAEDAAPEGAIDEWSASPWTKHVLLHQLYRDFGLASALIYAAHEITPAAWPWLPPAMRSQLELPLPDVQAFLRVQIGSEWMAVDATWPLTLRGLGVPVNERFDAGHNMRLACDPDELFHVPEDANAGRLYQAILTGVTGDQMERRARFFRQLTSWFDEQTSG